MLRTVKATMKIMSRAIG
jgi:hypothetical protein